MQYGTKITIWHEQRREVPNSKRELTKSSERQPNYAERSKMAEIYGFHLFPFTKLTLRNLINF
jgi:hypothetical protein